MFKKNSLAIVFIALLLATTIPITSVSANGVPRPSEIAVGTIGEPETVDPGWLYDTASGEIVMNVYDQLVAFMVDYTEPDVKLQGKTDEFSANLASEWYLDETDPDHPVFYFKIKGSHNNIITVFNPSIDPYYPVSTQWTETDPEPGNQWHIWKWHDNNADGYLSPCDIVKMDKKTFQGPDEMPWIAFHVQDVIIDEGYTLVLKELPIPFQCWRTVTLPGGFNPAAPVGNQVVEVGYCNIPEVALITDTAGRQYNIDDWEDGMFGPYDYTLSAGDVIQMTRKDVPPSEYIYGWTRDYIVESIDTEIMVVKPCLTCWDIEYSFERWFVLDHTGGPQWMIYEPLTYPDYGWPDENEDLIPDPEFAPIVDAAIETNCTWVWFTFASPFPPMIFLQSIAQSWASILYMDWAMDQGCWDGEWTTVPTYHDPMVSPLMDPLPVMCGTGPYLYVEWITGKHWRLERFEEHWQQWPVRGCEGYVDVIKVEFISEWPTRKLMFLAGDLDFCYVPTMYKADVEGKPGVRCTFPLPTLVTGGNFFNFNVSLESRYLYPPFITHLDYGVIDETGIPPDFFSDKFLRKAFSYCVNYTDFIEVAFLGESEYPATPAIYGLPYRRPESWYAENQYYLNLTEAEYYFKLAWGGSGENPGHDPAMVTPGQVWTKGFKLPLCYNTGNVPRRTMAEDQIETHVESLNPTKFHIDVYDVEWGTVYIPELFSYKLTMFVIGWQADYPDPHNFFFPFMHTEGAFSEPQRYSDPYVDALIQEGGHSTNATRRQEIYYELQDIYITDCPSVCTYQPSGRHWERTWIYGWYYNPIYSGGYFKHYWKDLPPGVTTMQPVDLSVWDTITNVTQTLITDHGAPTIKILKSDKGMYPTVTIEVNYSRVDTNTLMAGFLANILLTRTKGTDTYPIEDGYKEFQVWGPGDSGTVPAFLWNETDAFELAGTWTIGATTGVVSETAYDEAVVNNTVTDGYAIVYGTGDINGDGIVDGVDYQKVKKAIPSAPGDPNWNWAADINCDGIVDGTDYTIVKGLVPTSYV